MENLAKRDEAIRDAVLRDDFDGFKEISRDNYEAISMISDAEGKASPDVQRKAVEQNAYCSHCGLATFKPGYEVKLSSTGDIVLEGRCKQCGEKIIRLVEK